MRAIRGIAAAALSLGMTLLPAATSQAITGGERDGDAHPSVAMIVFYAKDNPSDTVAYRYRCSATLVAPRVLVTAAHCTDGTIGKTFVLFQSLIAEEAPSGLPRAADDAGTGSSTTGYRGNEAPDTRSNPLLRGATYYYGIADTHPDYSHFTDMRNWNDVGVVTLRQTPPITPSRIGSRGILDQIPGNQLSTTLFRVVGFGTEVRQSDTGARNPTPESYPMVRRYALEPGQKLTPQILQTNGNENDPRGTGGSCFGDSGGPAYHTVNGREYVVTVTSYGYTNNCRYIDGLQRLDIPGVLTWLRDKGVTP